MSRTAASPLDIRNAKSVVSSTIENSSMPIPRCIATRTACSFRSMTSAPSAICVTTKTVARELVTLIFRSALRFTKLATMVATTSAPVVAAASLCIHSIRYSSDGITPSGHRGHSGHVRPSPAADMYPPRNISEYSTIMLERARYWIAKATRLSGRPACPAGRGPERCRCNSTGRERPP